MHLRYLTLFFTISLIIGCDDDVPTRSENCQPDLSKLESFLLQDKPFTNGVEFFFTPKFLDIDTLETEGVYNWPATVYDVGTYTGNSSRGYSKTSFYAFAVSGDTMRIYSDWPSYYQAYLICEVNDTMLDVYNSLGDHEKFYVDTSATLMYSDTIVWQGR